jgi:hypothetical protein
VFHVNSRLNFNIALKLIVPLFPGQLAKADTRDILRHFSLRFSPFFTNIINTKHPSIAYVDHGKTGGI